MNNLISNPEAVRIFDTLDEVQNRSKVRTLTAEDVFAFVGRLEAELDTLGIPKKYREGSKGIMFEAGLPSAYKWAADTTTIRVGRTKARWVLLSASRESVYPRQKGRRHLILTDAQKNIVLGNLSGGVPV